MYGYDIMDLLGLPEYQLVGANESDDAIELAVEVRSDGIDCKVCGAFAHVIYDHRPPRQVRVETLRNRAVSIRPRPKRWRCDACEAVTQEPLPHVATYARQTDAFALKVQERALRHAATVVAQEEHLTYAAVRARLAEGMGAWQQPRVEWSKVRRIGIDEFANKKRHRYYLIIVDLDSHVPLAVLSQRTKLHLKAWLLQVRDLTTIEAFSSDMWAPYGAAVSEVFPEAVHVIDPFHVVAHAVEALDQVRRDLQKSLSKEARKPIWEARHRLHMNRDHLSEEQRGRLDALLEQHPDLKSAYWLKERLREWYHRAGDRAREGLRLWYRKAKRADLQPFNDVAEMLKRWEARILQFFRVGITNGVVEGINNKVKVIKRMCYGRLSYRNLRARVLFGCQGQAVE